MNFNLIFLLFLKKLKNSIQPNIYECKICGEHHCEHDFPEEDHQQELTPIIQQGPPVILHTPPLGHRTRIQTNQQTTNES